MNKVFTKRDLVMAVAKATGYTQTEIIKIFNATQKIQRKQLKLGFTVKTQNGQIKIVDRKARKGVHPQTGKTITIKACRKPKFVFSKDFKKGF